MHKWVGAILIVTWSLSRAYFWARSGRRKVVSSNMPLRRRLLLAVAGASFLPAYLYYFTPLLDRFDASVPVGFTWVGNLGLAASIALFVWSHHALGSAWSAGVDVAQGQRLVTSGPFRWLRHPMYASLLLLAASLILATHNTVASTPFVLATLAMYFERVGDEERLLARTFGHEYLSYARSTGRVLPRLWRPRG